MRQQEIANRWGRGLWRYRTLGTKMLAAAIVVLLACGPRAAHGISVERVSVTTDGTPADGSSLNPRTNADGTVVVFQSGASNLVSDDHNGHVDVFVVDRSAHTTERVSRSHLDGDPNDNSFPAVLSHDGRFVAYGSSASNIVVGDFNSLADVFIYDRESRQTQILSLSQDGFGGGAVPDLAPAISEDGVHVAFASQADNLVANDANEASDIFVHDITTGANEIVTYTSLGGPELRTGNGPSAGPSISDDGCVVAFFSDASDLVPSDTNQARDVFVRDRCAGTIERASVTSAGEQAQGSSQLDTSAPAVSADGRYIVFSSKAPNLDGADGSTVGNVFLRDRAAGTTTLVSKAQDGTPANGLSQWASVSADGRFVAFQSLASNLIADDTNGRADVFVVDLVDGEVQRVSVTAAGLQSDGDSTSPQLSSDGTHVVFQSSARLTPDDNDDFINIFVAENPLSGKLVPGSPTPTASETAVESPTETPIETPTPTLSSPDNTPTPTVTQTSPGIATVSPTPTVGEHGGTATPIRTSTTRSTPSATRTNTSSTPGSGGNSGGGGGGGCGCRVDPVSGAMVPDASWPALLLPVILLGLRRRHAPQRS